MASEVHSAIFHLTGSAIRDLLKMPDNARIINIRRDEYSHDLFEIVAEHPDLPVTREGSKPIVVTPRIEWHWY